MFEFDAGKIIIVGVIALIFIPPKDLPRALRQAGQFVGKMRRLAAEFQGQLMDAMREADMADLRQEAHKLSQAARASAGLDSLDDMSHQMTGSLRHDDDRSAKADATTGSSMAGALMADSSRAAAIDPLTAPAASLPQPTVPKQDEPGPDHDSGVEPDRDTTARQHA